MQGLSAVREGKDRYNEHNNEEFDTPQYLTHVLSSQYGIAIQSQSTNVYLNSFNGCTALITFGPGSGTTISVSGLTENRMYIQGITTDDEQISVYPKRVSFLLDDQGRALKEAEQSYRGRGKPLKWKYHNSGENVITTPYHEQVDLYSTVSVGSIGLQNWNRIYINTVKKQKQNIRLYLGCYNGGAEYAEARNEIIAAGDLFINSGEFQRFADNILRVELRRPDYKEDLQVHLQERGVSKRFILLFCLLASYIRLTNISPMPPRYPIIPLVNYHIGCAHQLG